MNNLIKAFAVLMLFTAFVSAGTMLVMGTIGAIVVYGGQATAAVFAIYIGSMLMLIWAKIVAREREMDRV